jgi:hypothetical protein
MTTVLSDEYMQDFQVICPSVCHLILWISGLLRLGISTTMRGRLPSSGALISTVMLAFGLIGAQAGENPFKDPSAARLIHFLTEPIDPLEHRGLYDTSGFEMSDRNRAAANSLVALGSAAIPDLDSAFDQIEQQGEKTLLARNSRWLLFAYARIRGPKAYQRLRAMIDSPRLRFLCSDLDGSLALALSLTSYVSASRVAYESIGFRMEPRYSLDAMILAWMQGNRTRMEEELGPNARSSLESLLAKRSWADLEDQMWHGPTGSDAAIGFRFETPGDWSKPEEALDQGLQNRRRYVNLDELPTEPRLLTQFVDKVGNNCVKREIRFARVPRVPEGTGFRYFVDDSDLEGLLRTISGCALHEP